ncbi:hypothetical protein BCR34DRAFT_183012 [Clohesyomyces aquaticus]|uniref:Exosome component 1 n=1 Tax=Clohesyomyces aquaticus TaxID=1231657 RepID=A0A1Y1ZYB5_9PLEO|nr:hypothetical protein BCR34DRAFT_183012 [Clohesyomyces aquaticus]
MSLPSIALPGQLLGPATKYAPGPGTHIHASNIYASIAGSVRPLSSKRVSVPLSTSTSQTSKPGAPKTKEKLGDKGTEKEKLLPLITVSHTPLQASDTDTDTCTYTSSGRTISSGSSNILPEVEAIVLARVTRLGARFATVEILVINDAVCRETFQGLVRREDVRATEKDRVRIEEVFRVGDLLRGVVISLGDQSNYYISTASDEYGVIMATSEQGNQMYPISWKEFRDPKTGVTEARKVAKPL